MQSFDYAEQVFYSPTQNLISLNNPLVLEQIRKEVKLAWFSSFPTSFICAECALLLWTSKLQHPVIMMEKTLTLWKKKHFYRAYLSSNVPSLVYNCLKEFLNWENCMQALSLVKGQSMKVQNRHKMNDFKHLWRNVWVWIANACMYMYKTSIGGKVIRHLFSWSKSLKGPSTSEKMVRVMSAKCLALQSEEKDIKLSWESL